MSVILSGAPKVRSRRTASIASGVAATILLAACGGGSHSVLPGNGSGSGSTSGGSGGAAQHVRVTFTMPGAPSQATRARMAARHREYVSYSSNGATIVYATQPSDPTIPVAGTAFSASEGEAFDVSSTSANCTLIGAGPARTCSLSLDVPAGAYNFVLTFWDQKPSSATEEPVGANVLSQSSDTPFEVFAGQTSTLPFTFSPVVQDILLNLSHPVLAESATSQTDNLSVVLKDVDGNVIIDDGTGATLTGAAQSALTVKLTATDTAFNNTTNCPGAAQAAATTVGGGATYSFTTVPSASIPVVYQGGCLSTDTLTSSVTGDTIGGTAGSASLNISGVTQEFPIAGLSSAPTDVVVGSDGNVYEVATSSGGNREIVVINPSTGATITTVNVPTDITPSANNCVNAMAEGSDGNVWYTIGCSSGAGLKALGYITPSDVVGDCSNPAELPPNDNPEGIVSGSDGNLWIADEQNGALVKATPSIVSCTGSAATVFTGPDYLIPPPASVPAGTDQTTGGTLPASTTFYFYLSYQTASGTTNVSPIGSGVSTSSGSTDSITFTLPALPAGATSYTVWAATGTTPGTEYREATGVPAGLYTFSSFNTATICSSITPAAPAAECVFNTATAPFFLAAGPDGNIWSTDQNYALEAMSTGGLLQHDYSTSPLVPDHITTFDSSHLAFDYLGGVKQIGFVSTSGTVVVDSNLGAFTPGGQLVTGADGNLYFPATSATQSAVGQLASSSATAVYFPLGLGSQTDAPAYIAPDLNGGNLWLGTTGADHAARFWLP